MLNQRTKIDVIEKFKTIRLIYDKIFISIAGSLWIFSTLWDIYKLQRYWLDYSIEFYSSFFIFYMILFSINQKSLPTKIYNSFKIITTIRGRGTMLLIISSMFLTDKHAFHKSCAILLFIGGIIYFICEFLVPTTKEELDQIESIYNKNINKNVNINNAQNKIDVKSSNERVGDSTAVFNNTDNNNIMNGNEETKNEFMNEKVEKDNSNTKEIKVLNIEEKISSEGENKKNENKIEEEKIQKTDNPYEIPEDF
jgi:hypothetical protein